MRPTVISIDNELHGKLKALALKKSMTLGRLVGDHLALLVARKPRQRKGSRDE